jgi:hypothetical protein
MSETTSEVENQELSPDNPEAPYHDAAASGGWRPLRSPDQALEPQDEALHLRGPQRHPHHRPAAHRAAVQPRLQLHRQHHLAGGSLLFVGTKKQAQEVMQQEALRAGQYHVTNRWLGGTLTNFRTVKGSIDRLRNLEKMAEDGTLRAAVEEGSADEDARARQA